MASPIMEKSLKTICCILIKQNISINWKNYPITLFSFGQDDLVSLYGLICFSIIMILIYDRSTLVFPGMKHAHLLKIKFIGLNAQQIKRADLMPGKTKVERS